MTRLTVLGLLILAAGCGARSSIGVGGGGTGPGPRPDGSNPSDGTTIPTDGPIITADSCVPIPAGLVEGAYAGSWEGWIRCPEGMAVGGELRFELFAASDPESFAVKGSLSGTVNDPPLTSVYFRGDIEGTMGCTALSARLSIAVGGEGPAFPLEGEMKGTFEAENESEGDFGFEAGAWKVHDPSEGYCTGSGTWTALANR